MPSNTGVAGPNNGGGSNVNVGALVGGIVGGVVGIALLLGLLWYYLKKKQAEDDDLYFASGGGIDSGPFSSGGGGNGGRHRSSVYDAEGPWAGSKASHDTGRSSPLPPGTDPDAVALIGINNSDPYAQPGGGGYGGGYGGYPPPQRWDEERGLGSSAGARLLDPSSSHARSTPRPAPTDYTNIVQHSGVGGNANFAPAVAGAPKPQQPYRSPWETPAAAATGASFRPPETLNAHQSTPGGAGLTTQFTITAYDARAGVGKVAAAVGVSGGGPAGGVSAKQVTSTRASSPALPPAYQPPSSLATPVLVDFKLSPIDDRPATGRLW
ncbi:hypothetical protein Q8F55_004042 [Vanrija albida]|uniref:Uncharacterized protein n=1 Tax=Vanrija albida TaxID=181172 RepID=A0ABR3Q5M0_9TREE